MAAQASADAVELPGVATWSWDLASNRMWANPAYCELLGLPGSEPLKPFHIVPMIADSDRDRVLASLFQTIAGESVSSVTFRIVRRDGGERTVIGRAVMVDDDRGMKSIVRGSLELVSDQCAGTTAPNEAVRMPQRAPVIISGRDRFSRLGLAAILSETIHIAIVGDVGLDEGAIHATWATSVETGLRSPVVLLDVDAPSGEFETLVASLLARDPRTRVIALVRYCALDVVAGLTRAGTARMLTAESTGEELQHAVWQLAFGREPQRTGDQVEPVHPVFGEHVPGFAGNAQLTPTEARVLRLLAMGQRNREIGATLFMSEPTVKRHTQQIYRKLGARDRAHAAALANHLRLLR